MNSSHRYIVTFIAVMHHAVDDVLSHFVCIIVLGLYCITDRVPECNRNLILLTPPLRHQR